MMEEKPKQQGKLMYESASIQLKVPEGTSEAIQRWSVANIPDSFLYIEEEEGQPPLGRISDSHITIKYGLRV